MLGIRQHQLTDERAFQASVADEGAQTEPGSMEAEQLEFTEQSAGEERAAQRDRALEWAGGPQ